MSKIEVVNTEFSIQTGCEKKDVQENDVIFRVCKRLIPSL